MASQVYWNKGEVNQALRAADDGIAVSSSSQDVALGQSLLKHFTSSQRPQGVPQ